MVRSNIRVKSLLVLVLAVAVLGSACVRKVSVNGLLPVSAPLSTEELIDRINAYGKIETFSAQANVKLWNYFSGEGSTAEEFPIATGQIRFKRPENTLMKVTFIHFDVADMVSDGRQFKLALYRPQDSRRFIYGSNLKDIERMNAQEVRDTKDKRLTKAGGLLNMRPQHITDSFLIKPITEAERQNVFREEVRQVEPDTTPGKKNRLIERSYYVLYVVAPDDKGQLKLLRKFWFDRTQQNQPGQQSTPLVRQQTFENGGGKLASDVTYSTWFHVTNTNREWPATVVIDRRNDGYRLKLDLLPASVEINVELPETTFTLENTEKLEELNLDEPRKTATEPPRKPQIHLSVNR